jgi:hypothetical protein
MQNRKIEFIPIKKVKIAEMGLDPFNFLIPIITGIICRKNILDKNRKGWFQNCHITNIAPSCCNKLRKKSLTMVEEAITQVKGFKELYQEFEDKVLISGNSSSALRNYARKVAEICLHFNRLLQEISEKDMNMYLHNLSTVFFSR